MGRANAADGMHDGRYLPQLDGLRAVAVGGVIALHSNVMGLPGGYVGVDIFFVLSGFLITGVLVRELEARGRIALSLFYWRRALRLMPAFALVLLFCVAFALVTGAEGHLVAVATSALYMMNWFRAFELGSQGLLGHTWSLAIEEQFYLIWPVLLIATLPLGRRKLVYLLLTLVIACALWRATLALQGASIWRTYNGFDTRADALFIGCLLRLVPPERVPDTLARSWIIPAAGLGYLALNAEWTLLSMHAGGFTVVALLAAWLIFSLVTHPDSALARGLSSRPLVYLGTISYGLYLWHFPIFIAFWTFGLVGPLWMSIATVSTLALASASFKFVELPVRALRNRPPRVLSASAVSA